MTSIYDDKSRKELDYDLSAEPGKPRSKGTRELMMAMAGMLPGMKPGYPAGPPS